MGQSAIILGIAATIIAGFFLFASSRTSNETDRELAEYHYKVLAREAAVTGLNLTVRKLVADPDNWAVTPASYGYAGQSYHNATFSVKVTAVDPDTVDIEATGVDMSGVQTIHARYAKGYSTIAVPPAFKYAIISDLDLTLNGQADILAVDETANASIHANGDLTSNGSQVTVEGYGSFGPDGSGSVNPEKAIDEIFQPNDDTNGGDSNLIDGDHIEIPSLDPDDFDEAPAESHFATASDTSLTGVLDVQAWAKTNQLGSEVGTYDDPLRLFVNGDLTLSGDVTILGYAQIITRGSIFISGNVTSTVVPVPAKTAPESDWDAWREANLDASGNTKIGWYAGENITVSGNSNVVGQLYANNTISLNGGGGAEMNIVGGVTSTNVDINVNGGIVIQYAEISEKVVIPGFTKIVPEGVRLLAWAEW